MVCLENETLKIWIKPKGAELKSLVNNVEHIWEANPTQWGKSSPVLFPIVGGLKSNTYKFQGNTYELPRHGFARDRLFAVESKSAGKATFLLTSDTETREVYPFDFEFRISYSLEKNKVNVSYEIRNTSTETMWFSVGGHPAFAVPFDGESYDLYFLEFENDESLNIWPLSSEGLILENPAIMSLNNRKLRLTKKLFHQDALVLKDFKSTFIDLKSEVSGSFLRFSFPGFPFFGIWAAKDANFVCLEPWCGVADSVNHNQELTQKEGIHSLPGGELFTRSWGVEVL